MIAAFLHCAADVDRLLDLLTFIGQLGGCRAHDALLVADAATPYAKCAEARRLALASFKEVRCISNGAPVLGWPAGPNSLFRAAAQYIPAHWPNPWLLLETDCVPLKPGWLDAIADEYAHIEADYMGCLYQGTSIKTGQPVQALSGIAVYPATAAETLFPPNVLYSDQPWDMANREFLLENSYDTDLIHHFYGLKDLAPTFVTDKTGHTEKNALSLADIPPKAVLWHRCKDGSLIRLLRQKLGIKVPSDPRIVIAYTCVAKSTTNFPLAHRFITSLLRFPAGLKHTAIAICNGGPPPQPVRSVLENNGFVLYPRSNDGWDIGGYIDLSRTIDADLMVCLGESVFMHKAGWLQRLIDAWRQHGPGMYGVYSSFLVRPHMPTTAFAITPSFLKSYPVRVIDRATRYNFEHGINAEWQKVQQLGGVARLVTWNGIYDPPNWRKPKNILWTGDQSECLVWCNHTDRYARGTPAVKRELEVGANGLARLTTAGVIPKRPPQPLVNR